MENVLDVAQFIYDEYQRETGDKIDEMKLHKLLYFAQRLSLAMTDNLLFKENMEGWVYGPVSVETRARYTADQGINYDTKKISAKSQEIIRNIIAEYGQYESWRLKNLSHEDISWKNSRIGLSSTSYGFRDLKVEDIREDAKKVRPFDYAWGGYYDEFDDYEDCTN